ncbi:MULTISPECIES: preprotein translocase subunit SecE [Albibacterium]|jgi:preprotein translocase subunit SecE|uniref:Protein translocase subunit SecE n=1 Tax=Albibacterium bauzanense TaxID=653929 RepID=A0A4R1LQJ2_9SPHI|nr:MULTISPECIES: preprotein translocase subunit SecE [Albibacterium]TCK80737.1 preprotein translocase subunit SecE [Albibacterium bauzanense]HUH18135.1 preprotein translocase subunit SecE [Albibacterium sp.]
MASVLEFFKESYNEMIHKVTWPTWGELQNSAVVVLIASLIIALIILAMDESSSSILKLFYQSVG